MTTNASGLKRRILEIKGLPLDGTPCDHPGCLAHVSHPCEGCGRVGGESPDWPGDVKAAFDLFDEMASAGLVKLSNGDGDSKDLDFLPFRGMWILEQGETWTGVISQAWLAWKEG